MAPSLGLNLLLSDYPRGEKGPVVKEVEKRKKKMRVFVETWEGVQTVFPI